MNIVHITDLSAPGVDVFSKLTETQLRNRLDPEKGIFIAESPKVIKVALDEGYEPLAMLTTKRHIEGDARELIARCGDIPIYTGEVSLLSELTGYLLTRGVLCAMRRPKPHSVKEVCENARRVVVLDNVVDNTNVGAIFRSAAALGFDALLLTPTACDPLNRRTVRVSMGTVFQIPWAYIGTVHTDWPNAGMEQLRRLGFKTAAMALSDNSISIEDPALVAEKRLAVIIGTEGDGLSARTINGCDYVVRIPMFHNVDSLNVAAASAVAFWQLRAR
ncbi:MAG: RNA methyltransferase [Bacteroidales bacterium]|nr:RNA methyltransferase [Bacteroidales bacterium]MDD6582977.1 RNA methyltransferase [Bacteroidales bacterium]